MEYKPRTEGRSGARSGGKAGGRAGGKAGGFKGKKRAPGIFRKRYCRFCKDKIKNIDFKDIKLLEGFISERGKMNSPRYSGNCAKHQRRIAQAIKRARYISLIPYTRV
ncbi:MAG: 30S ribosomal protein S18 [Candidatus Omnitrophica bacterium]|nr:30S ribosomal protein S18 [Candidatus Omnitrophota bacterium]